MPLTLERLETVASLWRAPEHVHRLLDDALALPPPEPKADVPRGPPLPHVLVDGDRVTGLLDWIDLCRGDPALDLQVVWSVLPPEQRDRFFDVYGDVDEATLLPRACDRLLPEQRGLEYSHHEGLASIEREAIASLDRASSE